MKSTIYTKGMHCTACEQLVTEELIDNGAKESTADFKTGKVVVNHDKSLSLNKIKHIIREEGYEVLE
ncbi:MAG: heavy metal-associated domain-containing protein [archaeon]